MLRLDEPGIRILAGVRDFFFPPKSPYRFWESTSFIFSGYLGYFPGMKWPERDVYYPSQFSADVKSEWSPVSSPYAIVTSRDKILPSFAFTFSVYLLK